MKEILRIFEENIEIGRTLAIVTVVSVTGSAPQRTGAKMIISQEGKRLWGTIGGGNIEKIAIDQALNQINEGIPLLKEYKLTEEGKDSTGMLCGGNMTIFFDIIGITEKVYIFGAGHISQKLVPLLNSLGFWTLVIDDRKEFLDENFKETALSKYIWSDFLEYINKTFFDPNSYVIIITYSHDLDEKILKQFLTNKSQEVNKLKYLGMIGSKRKVNEIFTRLESQGVESSQLLEVHAPIGIDIGSQTPEEIAISIAAEVIKIRNK